MSSDLSAAIKANLITYSSEISAGVKKAVDKNVDVLEADLKRDSPKRKGSYRRQGKYRPGSYARSWRTIVTSNTFSTYRKEVFNKDHYQLTHLLEKGHAKRGGGRVAARVHIAPAEEKAVKNYEKDIEKLIKATQ